MPTHVKSQFVFQKIPDSKTIVQFLFFQLVIHGSTTLGDRLEWTTKRAHYGEPFGFGQGMGFGARMHSLEEVPKVFAMFLPRMFFFFLLKLLESWFYRGSLPFCMGKTCCCFFRFRRMLTSATGVYHPTGFIRTSIPNGPNIGFAPVTGHGCTA